MHSNVRSTSRSMGGWVSAVMRPPERCLRKSIQNMGGWAGF